MKCLLTKITQQFAEIKMPPTGFFVIGPFAAFLLVRNPSAGGTPENDDSRMQLHVASSFIHGIAFTKIPCSRPVYEKRSMRFSRVVMQFWPLKAFSAGLLN